MFDEKKLIWRCRRGNGEALCEIYERYKQDMLSLAAAMVYDRSQAEDVVHDVFVSFAGRVSELRLRTRLRSYLLRCVANRVRNLHKAKANQQKSLEIDVADGELSWPDRAAMSAETAGRIGRAMSQLPDEQREVIVLRLEGRLTFKEIAEIQQVSMNTVNSRYRYGLEKLRGLLGNEVEL